MERILITWNEQLGEIVQVQDAPVYYCTGGNHDKVCTNINQGKTLMASLGFDISILEAYEANLEQMKAAAKAAK